METEVKLQLMESALEAMSMQDRTACDPHSSNDKVDSSTSTSDLEVTVNSKYNEVSVSDLLKEKVALENERRRLKQQLIVSQISTKQYKSECLLHRAKHSEKMLLKKRKCLGTDIEIRSMPKQINCMAADCDVENLPRHQPHQRNANYSWNTKNEDHPSFSYKSKNKKVECSDIAYTVRLIDASDKHFHDLSDYL